MLHTRLTFLGLVQGSGSSYSAHIDSRMPFEKPECFESSCGSVQSHLTASARSMTQRFCKKITTPSIQIVLEPDMYKMVAIQAPKEVPQKSRHQLRALQHAWGWSISLPVPAFFFRPSFTKLSLRKMNNRSARTWIYRLIWTWVNVFALFHK